MDQNSYYTQQEAANLLNRPYQAIWNAIKNLNVVEPVRTASGSTILLTSEHVLQLAKHFQRLDNQQARAKAERDKADPERGYKKSMSEMQDRINKKAAERGETTKAWQKLKMAESQNAVKLSQERQLKIAEQYGRLEQD